MYSIIKMKIRIKIPFSIKLFLPDPSPRLAAKKEITSRIILTAMISVKSYVKTWSEKYVDLLSILLYFRYLNHHILRIPRTYIFLWYFRVYGCFIETCNIVYLVLFKEFLQPNYLYDLLMNCHHLLYNNWRWRFFRMKIELKFIVFYVAYIICILLNELSKTNKWQWYSIFY